MFSTLQGPLWWPGPLLEVDSLVEGLGVPSGAGDCLCEVVSSSLVVQVWMDVLSGTHTHTVQLLAAITLPQKHDHPCALGACVDSSHPFARFQVWQLGNLDGGGRGRESGEQERGAEAHQCHMQRELFVMICQCCCGVLGGIQLKIS